VIRSALYINLRGSRSAGVGSAAVHWQTAACKWTKISHPSLRPMCRCASHDCVVIAKWRQGAHENHMQAVSEKPPQRYL
jgi:hypothetical protein